MSNIFSFLGLAVDHRKCNKVVQLVKHITDVPKSKYTFPLLGQVKKDGVYAMVVSYQGRFGIFGRTGKQFTSTNHLLDKWDWLPEGIYIAELCNDACSLEVLSGMVNPNRSKLLLGAQDELMMDSYLAFHDMLTVDEFILGKAGNGYQVRHQALVNVVGLHYVLHCYQINSMEEAEAFAQKHIDAGEEGAVFKGRSSAWIAGHKGYRAMKIVRGVDYDLRCIGYEEGTGKYAGKVANLIFQWKGNETIKCMLGKGWTHEMAAKMFKDILICGEELDPRGRIFQVYALQESSKGKLRLPKVGELRHDKETPDV